MICNVAVNEQGTSEIKNMMSNNLTPATPEDATSGKTNYMQKIKSFLYETGMMYYYCYVLCDYVTSFLK